MKGTILGRSTALTVAAVMAACFGFTGLAAANATITNTGPDSTNVVSTENDTYCEIENNNNVEVNNSTAQSAQSGDVTVSHNTTAGSGWGAWDPVVWQHQGYTYAQWQAAFNAYLANHAADWQTHWGSLAGNGGITSGNASNTNATQMNVGITNDPACVPGTNGGGGGSIDTTGPGSTNVITAGAENGSVLGNYTRLGLTNSTGQGAETGNILGAFNTSLSGLGSGGAGNGNGTGAAIDITNNPTTSGGGGGGGGGGSTPTAPAATINDTGPDSTNTISYATNTTTTINNTSSILLNNLTTQSSQTGDATATYNTNVGSPGSGEATNASSSDSAVAIQN